MRAFCGLDFGTSNTTIGIQQQNHCQLVPLEGTKTAIRSAIFCDAELKQWVFGQEGVNSYLEGNPGRLLMSLKSVLGSTLMEDETFIFGEFIAYKKILGHFIRHIKSVAESKLGHEITQVVMGRPVYFHDTDMEKDRYAQDTLENIARDAGFTDILFQYEPIAAALTYEMTIQKEQLALIIDMGGGTSDFSLIRLTPGNKKVDRTQDVLANCGIHIAGTDFDQRLSLKTVMPLLGMHSLMRGSSSDIEVPAMYYHDLTTWHTLSNLYSNITLNHVRTIQTQAHEKERIARLLHVLKTRAGHHVLHAVESVKQRLSDSQDALLDLTFIENDLSVLIERTLLNTVIDDQLQTILATIEQTAKMAGVKTTEVNAIFYTGGSSKIPVVRERINHLFPQSTVIQGDAFGSVGLGLTIDAQRRFV